MFTLVFLPSLGPWLHCAIIMWALITALSRAAMGRHYAGDVLAGIFVGFVNVLLLTKVHGSFLCFLAYIMKWFQVLPILLCRVSYQIGAHG